MTDIQELIPDRLFFTPYQAATLFAVSVKTIYFWIDTGKLDAVRIAGRTVRIPRAALQKIIDEMNT